MSVTKTYTSSEYSISNGSTTAHTTLSDITMGDVFVRWKGVDQSGTGWKTVSDTIWVYAEGSGGASVGIPNPTGATSAGYYVTALNQSGVNGDMYINGSYVGFIQSYGHGYLAVGAAPGTTASASAYVNGGSGAAYVWIEAWCNYTYQQQVTTTLKTDSPSVTSNGYTASHSGPINNGYWTSWIAAPTGFIVEGANTISHTVAGSGSAKFQFKYDYIRNVPTATGYLKFRGKGQTYSVRIANPTDPSLDYTCVRIYDDAIRCLDVVATTDPEASPLRIYTSKHGTLAFRKVV